MTNEREALEALHWLKKLYHFILMHTKEGKAAFDYLLNRGINQESIRYYSLGFVPEKVNLTLVFLKNKGFNLNKLEEGSVLYRHHDGKLTTIFKGRLVFPIQDHQNRTVAFGGRLIFDKENAPKYLNSPESSIFLKKDCLFGLDFAKEEIQHQGYAILLEGYFDVLAASQEGIKNVVATLGTAITTNQALLLKGITKNVVIAYDGDAAGMDNSFRVAATLEEVGCNVRIAYIPNEADPHDFLVSNTGAAFMKTITSALPTTIAFIDYQSHRYNLEDAMNCAEYTSEVLKVISRSNHDEREALLKLQEILGISLHVIMSEVTKYS